MSRIGIYIVTVALVAGAVAGPAGAASKPTVSITNPGDCQAITYRWSSFSKARTAELRIHHFGVFETSRSLGPVAASGSFTMPADVVFVPGDQYTVLGVLLDSGNRAINPSGAAWWGTC